MEQNQDIMIFDPKIKPYGALSNNKKYSMELDGYLYPSVTHYTYTSILHFPTFKALVRNTQDTKMVAKVAQDYYMKEIEDTVVSSIFEAYKVLFLNNTPRQVLLSTGNSNIVYISNDLIMGTQVTNEGFIGQNQVGNCLMRLRKEIREEELFSNKTKESEAMNETIYKIYKAYSALDGYVMDNKKDVEQYRDYTYEEFLDLAPPNMTYPEKSIVMQLYKQGKLDFVALEIENPGNLVDIYRKINIEKIRDLINIHRNSVIFNMYIEYWMRKLSESTEGGVSDTDRRKVIETFKSRLTGKGYADLRQRVLYLYKKGFLSANLSKEIEEKLAEYTEITSKQVKTAKNFEISHKVKGETVERESNGKILYISDSDDTPQILKTLSPNTNVAILEIKNKKYPTVYHYTINKLIALLNDHTVESGYKEMITEMSGQYFYISIDEYISKYNSMKEEEYVIGMEKSTKKAMDKKFQDLTLSKLLLSTGDKKLIYTDRNPILGTGTNQYRGSNFVGQYLMELRTKIYTELQELKKNILKVEDISNVLIDDKFFKAWLEKRLDELCNLTGIIQSYFMEKYGLDYPVGVNTEFIQILLEEFYGNCFKLYMENIDAQVPSRFVQIVEGCKMFGEITPDIVKLLWRYFASIIYTLIKSVQTPSSINIRQVIIASQKRMTKLDKHQKLKVTGDQLTDSIYCAFIHIMNILTKLSEQYIQSPYFLGIADIDTAARIILNNSDIDFSRMIDTNGDKISLPRNEFTPEIKTILATSLKKFDSNSGPNLAEYFADMFTYMKQTNILDKNNKINRINYFCEQ